MSETAQAAFAAFWDSGFGAGSRLWTLCLITTLFIGFALFRIRRVKGSFLGWLMPRSVWTNESHIVDIKLFVVSPVLSILGLFPGGVSISMLLGVDATCFLFNMLGANFRHSHIWLGYGRVLEHILISPAQHQSHHSLAPNTTTRIMARFWPSGTGCLARSISLTGPNRSNLVWGTPTASACASVTTA